jgi:uncharacterized protein YegL
MPDSIKKSAKTLPVILMLDVSGSMEGEPIHTLNESVKEMLEAFSKDESVIAEIKAAVVTFGGDAKMMYPLTNANELKWTDMSACGGTPLGSAISIVEGLVEDKEKIPSNAYRPAVVLVSDGVPTDDWRSNFDSFLNAPRTSKCHRLALGVNMTEGDPAYRMLSEFVSKEEKVFLGDAKEIVKFFKYVTMSVGTRTKSVNPNIVPNISGESDFDVC